MRSGPTLTGASSEPSTDVRYTESRWPPWYCAPSSSPRNGPEAHLRSSWHPPKAFRSGQIEKTAYLKVGTRGRPFGLRSCLFGVEDSKEEGYALWPCRNAQASPRLRVTDKSYFNQAVAVD